MSDPVARASWLGTVLFVVTAVGAALGPVPEAFAAGVSLALFGVGIGLFFWAYAVAVGRSRTDEIGIGGLFFLAGDVAPKAVKLRLLAPLAVQVAVALVTAAARPFTSLAFGVLVPIFGLALCGLWAARHGTFGRRPGRGANAPKRTI